MRVSLNVKIILSMTGMVFLTSLACSVVFLIIINNQTREFESRLEKVMSQAATPPPAADVIDKLKTIISNPDLSADAQLAQVRQSIHSPQVDQDRIRQAAADSGWPIQPGGVVVANNQNPNTGGVYKIKDDTLPGYVTSPMYNSIIIASGISALFAIVLGFLLSRTVISPLRKLEQASERIADGNYNLLITPEGKDDLGRLAASFNKMSKALRLTQQKRKDLVADLSHELRTPLSSVQGYTEVLRDGLVTDSVRRNNIYDHILLEVKHMSSMVNSMREWINNEQSLETVRPEEIEIGPELQLIVNRFRHAAEEKNIKLSLDVSEPSAHVFANPEALSHILNNLIDNSLRYTPVGGEIRVEVKELPKERQIYFEVRDNGCGIPNEHQPFVFERFYRVDKSRDRGTGGTGLGLAIARDAIQAMGGEIGLESEVGQGTRVMFKLPSIPVSHAIAV
ncbi:MAG: HAMP domain-containing histidine kinase [Chloroflexi bacterium]|uniref:histidine kinase n=1 Tax=Candidatus Chlorohelix allophototropha TaxID=3003348 RepID=A0A8T7MAN1_9CHLR|nr:HAMP domain-containing histidine kinase [Chloroflexota bacterium]WJW68901.1 HAMP domain-containing histidine kinase [Chloroflexota bacterium L227-S17]